MPSILDPNWQVRAFAPLMRLLVGKGMATEQAAKTALGAVMLPGEVYKNPGMMINPDTGRTSDYAINRSADLAQMMTLGSGAIPAEANSLRMGIRAYHGSPHDFDRFDMSKIGTGEGAQAYGHGLYFAENEGVAQGYRDALKRKNDKITFDGRPLDGPSDYNALQSQLENQEGDWRLFKAVDEITRRQGTMEERLADMRNWYRNQPEMLAAIDRAEQRATLNANPGRMYEVNIDANPEDFLDWDKPLSEQPKWVRDQFPDSPNISGKEAYDRLARQHGRKADASNPQDKYLVDVGTDIIASDKGASQALRKAGVPGIKYLDAGSRGAGDGTRNYVVFDDKLISIVKKYGVAALVAAGVLNQVQGEELKARGYY